MYEVENKYRNADIDQVRAELEKLGAEFQPPIEQIDRYYAHPSRDFAQTDEALRIRRNGDKFRITYKGPKVDKTTKTRKEIEVPLPDGGETDRQFGALPDALGFKPVIEVKKTRTPAEFTRGGREFEVALDQVDQVGDFVEIETSAGSDEELDAAREALEQLAADFGLQQTERRSYLELLLETLGKQ